MNSMNLVAVFVQNKPGQTARITKILSSAGVNVCWVTIANSGAFGVMKFLVDQPNLAMQSLRTHGLMVSQMAVLAVQVDHQPGALQSVAELLSQNGLNLDNCSGFISNGHAVLILEVHDIERAEAILTRQGLRLLTPGELTRN